MDLGPEDIGNSPRFKRGTCNKEPRRARQLRQSPPMPQEERPNNEVRTQDHGEAINQEEQA
jgi:hypothetical protein